MTDIDLYQDGQGAAVVYDEPAIVPVADARPTWHEVGRIRVGVKVPVEGKPGKFRPAKLSRFRLTSPDQALIEHAAERYGGEPVPWDDAPGADREGGEQWQVLTQTSRLPVLIPPAAAASQAWEAWSGGGCERRCDGHWEAFTAGPCVCAAETEEAADAGRAYERPCRLTTRLSVMLPELPGTGIWRLETHSAISGNELATWLRIVFPHLPPMAPLVLRVEKAERTRRIPDPNAPKGWRPQTFVFPLISIDTRDTTIGELLAGGGHQAVPAPAPVREVAGRVAGPPQRQGVEQTSGPAAPAPPGPGSDTAVASRSDQHASAAAPAGTGDTGVNPAGHEPPAAAAPAEAATPAAPASPGAAEGKPGRGRRRSSHAGPRPDAAAPAGPDQQPPVEERSPVIRWCLANQVPTGQARLHLAGEHAEEFGDVRTLNDLAALEGERAERAIGYLDAAERAGVFEPDGWRP